MLFVVRAIFGIGAALALAGFLFGLVSYYLWRASERPTDPEGVMQGAALGFLGLFVAFIAGKWGDYLFHRRRKREAVLAEANAPRTRRKVKAALTEADPPKASSAPQVPAQYSQRKAALEATARSGPVPGWALVFRSPFGPERPVHSWMGGNPSVPPEFVWPRNRKNEPLLFVAQIDLAEVKPEPLTGHRPNDLPETGSLVAFVAEQWETPQVVILTEDDYARSVSTPMPPVATSSTGIPGPFGRHTEQGLRYWPVDLVPFKDPEENRPAELRLSFGKIEDWITTNGYAVYEAETRIKGLRWRLDEARKFLEERGEATEGEKPFVAERRARSRIELQCLPQLISELEDYVAATRMKPKAHKVDKPALAAILAKRAAVNDLIKDGDEPLFDWETPDLYGLGGHPARTWEALANKHGYLSSFDAAKNIPEEFREVADHYITRWHGHQLFGPEVCLYRCTLGTVQPNYYRDRSLAVNCVLSIESDPMLGLEISHASGVSIVANEAPADALGDGAPLLMDWHFDG